VLQIFLRIVVFPVLALPIIRMQNHPAFSFSSACLFSAAFAFAPKVSVSCMLLDEILDIALGSYSFQLSFTSYTR
jgi:hypothetical protein